MRKLLLLITSVAVVCLTSAFSRHYSQNQRPAAETETATPVEDGVLTAQQKEHSKLYEEPYKSERKIRDVLLEKPGGLTAYRTACIFIPGKPMPSIVSELAEQADAIVTASFVSKFSQITANGTYVFTDYDLRIQEILKSNSGALRTDQIITVTRPGGKVLLYGQTATFTSLAFKPLLPGHRYLMFLTYLPATGAYRAVSHEGTFDITNTTVETLTEGTARGFEKELSAFLASVKVAVSSQKKGGAQ